MTDLKMELITLLEAQIPELRDKIQAGAVNERTAVPFAAFTTPDETPVRTMHGIAGYVTTFEVAVYEQKTSALERLKYRVIAALEGQVLIDRRCSLKSSATDYYADYDIYGVTLVFKVI